MTALALALYVLVVVNSGPRLGAAENASLILPLCDNSCVQSAVAEGIELHFQSVDPGSAFTILRIKVSRPYFNLSSLLEHGLTQELGLALSLSGNVLLQPDIRQVIFPFHTFW